MASNTPNAGKLMESLRYLGYNNYSAICDIVDNSFDAEASNVWIVVHQTSGKPEIQIADDGVGMNEAILDQALRLGSLTDRNEASDLGKYGMGLSTASLSLARQTTVLTRCNGKVLKSAVDLDEMKVTNTFDKYLGDASDKEIELFGAFIPKKHTGTLVILNKCDNVKNSNLSVFRSTLKPKLGQIYRYYINSGKNIFVNGEKVEARDPMMLEDGSEIFSDESFEFDFSNEDGASIRDSVRVRVAVLPDFGTEESKLRKVNQGNQGFYVLRNNREIAMGKTFGIFNRHNDLNRFRAEIFFSGALDEPMGVNFTKHDVDPSQAMRDKISGVVVGQLRTIRTRVKSARVVSEDVDITHEESEKAISAKSHLLLKPKAKVNLLPAGTKQNAEDPKQGPSTPGNNGNSTKGTKPPHNVQFDAAKLGKLGPIYEAEQVGKLIVITWNIEHPFYERFILQHKNDKELRTSVDFLIYSMATAELLAKDDDNFTIIENIRTVMSSNLRSLLS